MDQPWYQDFVSDEKMDRDMLFNMLSAANFLGIKPLLDLTCLKVTFQITGKNAEEVSYLLYPWNSVALCKVILNVRFGLLA